MAARFVFLCLLAAYSFAGIVFFRWSIFYVVYLYWFENVIGIFAKAFEVASTPSIAIQAHKNQPATKWEAIGSLFGSLLLNTGYFVFILVGIGVLYPVFILSNTLAKEFIFDALQIVLFMNNTFNIALGACVAYKAVVYLRDFVFSKKYTVRNPLPFPTLFSKQDLVLHLTILLGVGSVFLLHHPDFGGKYGLDRTKWGEYGIGIMMIAIKMSFELYYLQKSK